MKTNGLGACLAAAGLSWALVGAAEARKPTPNTARPQASPDEPFDRAIPIEVDVVIASVTPAADGVWIRFVNPRPRPGIPAGDWAFRFGEQAVLAPVEDDRAHALAAIRGIAAPGRKVSLRGYRWKADGCKPECLAEATKISTHGGLSLVNDAVAAPKP